MAKISNYLSKAAHVESFGRQIKSDDVSYTLAHKAHRVGSWTTHQLSPREFFVSCPDNQTIQNLTAEGHIRGDGFSLITNYWNQFRGGILHDLKFKVYATLKNLPLFCWTVDIVATIISSFGSPCRASHSSLRWEDLSGFDIVFFCETVKNVPKSIHSHIKFQSRKTLYLSRSPGSPIHHQRLTMTTMMMERGRTGSFGMARLDVLPPLALGDIT